MHTLLMTLALLAQTMTGLSVHLVDPAGHPVPDAAITLTTYNYRDGQAFVRETVMCITDAGGDCTLLLDNPDRSGMQYGVLTVTDMGTRDVVWPGGMLFLVIPTDQITTGREAAPFDFERRDGGVPIHSSRTPLYGLIVLLILTPFFWFLVQQSHREHNV